MKSFNHPPKTIDACGHPKHSAAFSTDDNDFHSKLAVAEVRSPGSKEHAPKCPGILNGTTSKFLNGKKKTAQINSEKTLRRFLILLSQFLEKSL